MSKGARGLEHARGLYRARRFHEVLRLLEPQIYRFRTDPGYYALLGMSCLRTGEIGGAATYLGRASQLDDQNVEVLLGLAAVHLARHEPEDAVACWLRVLDLEPGSRIARRGLDAVRTAEAGSPGAADGAEALQAYLPRVSRRFPWKALLAAFAVVAVSAGGFLVVRLLADRPGPASRPGVEEVLLPSGRLEILAASSTGTSISMTERELSRSFARAKRHLMDYRDNLAVHELNRILLSNASAAVKERAELLKSFAEEPDFSTIRDAFPYSEVKLDALQYADCHVRWAGRTANVTVSEDLISFDLLVGYQDGRVLEGVVRVHMRFAASVEEGGAYEVLGRVDVPQGGGLRLEAVSIRPIAPRPGAAS